MLDVTIKELTQITLSGAARINVSALSGGQVCIEHSGAGTLNIGGAMVRAK